MTSLRFSRYEDHLTYPVVIGNQIREVPGSVINNWDQHQPKVLSEGEWDQLQQRIQKLEQQVAHLSVGYSLLR